MDLKMGVTIVQLTVGSVTSRQRYQASSELQQQQDQLHVIHNTDAGMYLHPLLMTARAVREAAPADSDAHNLFILLSEAEGPTSETVTELSQAYLELLICHMRTSSDL